MDATADYPSSPYLSDVDASESAPSTPEPNLSDPRSLRLSDVAHFLNSSAVVCISSGESDEPPPPKKKLTDVFKSAKMRTPAFANVLRQYDPYPGGTQKQASATSFESPSLYTATACLLCSLARSWQQTNSSPTVSAQDSL